LIDVDAVSVCYGSATALDRVSLRVSPGEMVALVGSNGAGKSTLLKALSGVVPTAGGSIRIRGKFAHVPEGRQLFQDLSVDDNLRLGALGSRQRDTSWIYEIFPDLAAKRRQPAGSLSGGQQQMVALGRGLMAQPDVLAIDEMSLGLAPLVVRDIGRKLKELNAGRGLAVLLVEQNARLALSLCDMAYVLETGRLVAQGRCDQLIKSPLVLDAYLGSQPGADS
jgi:branched-chain amino acid transport system ATP-binding protein